MVMWLVGEHHGAVVRQEIDSQESSVGRGSDNELVLASQTVSRHHAKLSVEKGRLRILDLGSLNGTRVNGETVEGEAWASSGDTVEFGSVRLWVNDSGAQPSTLGPSYSDDKDISQSVFLSREEISDTGSAGVTPEVMRLLTEAGQLLVHPASPEDTFDRILQLVERTIPSDRVLILTRDGKDDEPVQRAARVNGDRAISRLMLSRTMIRMVLDEGGAFLTGDVQSDERFMNQQSVVAQDLHSAMAVPLVHHNDTLGVLYVDTSNPITSYEEKDLRVLTLLGQMLGTKVANAKLISIAREQERMQEELRTAARIQQRLLPQTMPDIPGYELVAMQDTCEAVGGDLYDAGLVAETGIMQFCLGDISGKGIGAALLMSEVLATMRAMRSFGIEAADLVVRLDQHVLQTTQPEHYLTLFLAELDPSTHRIVYVNGGHPPAFLLHADGHVDELESTGPPVGLVDLPGLTFEQEEVEMPPGSTLIIYSDGVSESERGEEQFGDEGGRFEAVVRECVGLDAAAVAQHIEDEVDRYLGDRPRMDDLTLVVLRRAG